MLHGTIINFRRRIVNQTLGFSCRAAAQFNDALQRTRPSRRGCNRTPSWAGSLSLGRYLAPTNTRPHSPDRSLPRNPLCEAMGVKGVAAPYVLPNSTPAR